MRKETQNALRDSEIVRQDLEGTTKKRFNPGGGSKKTVRRLPAPRRLRSKGDRFSPPQDIDVSSQPTSEVFVISPDSLQDGVDFAAWESQLPSAVTRLPALREQFYRTGGQRRSHLRPTAHQCDKERHVHATGVAEH
jgi:hypothetical protein